jgi:hypothetical protein
VFLVSDVLQFPNDQDIGGIQGEARVALISKRG